VLLHNGKLALRSSSDEEFKQRKEKEKEEKEKNAQAQKDRLAKKKAAAKAAKKSKSRPTTPAEPEEKEEKKEEAADKDAAKTEEGEPDFRTLPSVGTWFTGLHPEEEVKKDEEKAKEGEKQKDEKANEDEEIYKSWWPPPDCETAAEVVKPGQWNLLTLVVRCGSSSQPEHRFAKAYLNGEVAFHAKSHAALE
ncbi:unnamed protein product, partial [Symbiodinium necroappetens]